MEHRLLDFTDFLDFNKWNTDYWILQIKKDFF
jgi:hypothetical protein